MAAEGDTVTVPCSDAERLWAVCLRAAMAYHDAQKMEFLALIRRDPQFSNFADSIALARQWYDAAKSDLNQHLATHRCWKHKD
jgi:hypothetical protein